MSGGGAEPHLSPRLRVVVDAATADAKQMQDDYVSTEHLLLGLAAERGPFRVGRALKQRGVTRERMLEALDQRSRQPARDRSEPGEQIPGAREDTAATSPSSRARASSIR